MVLIIKWVSFSVQCLLITSYSESAFNLMVNTCLTVDNFDIWVKTGACDGVCVWLHPVEEIVHWGTVCYCISNKQRMKSRYQPTWISSARSNWLVRSRIKSLRSTFSFCSNNKQKRITNSQTFDVGKEWSLTDVAYHMTLSATCLFSAKLHSKI